VQTDIQSQLEKLKWVATIKRTDITTVDTDVEKLKLLHATDGDVYVAVTLENGKYLRSLSRVTI
jgi:hypothetical protein